MTAELLTEEQKQFCMRVAQWMERIKTFPGGTAFIVDLFNAAISAEGLTVADAGDPKISLRRAITQELYDVVWMSRQLRKVGFNMEAAQSLGLRDLYATHGSQGLVRFLDLAMNAALHNAGLEGFSRSALRARAVPAEG